MPLLCLNSAYECYTIDNNNNNNSLQLEMKEYLSWEVVGEEEISLIGFELQISTILYTGCDVNLVPIK